MENTMSHSAYMDPWMEHGNMRDGDPSLAIAKVVSQPEIKKVYNTLDALKRGTLFPDLDKPWVGKRGAY